MDLESPFFKILAIIAHILELITILYAAIYGLLKKSKSVTGFIVSKFITGLVKLAVILFISIYIFKLCELVYFFTIQPLKGNTTNYYWEKGYEVYHIIAYSVQTIITLTFIWLVGATIWTGSLNPIKVFLNYLLPKNKQLSIRQLKTLTIINSRYGANDSYFDVTEKLRKMIQGNTLTITASNDLAGDPIYGVLKKLIIEYKYEGEEKATVEISEGESKLIQPN